MIQSLVNEYKEDDTKEILKNIYKNAGVHLEQSGSAPLKKGRADLMKYYPVPLYNGEVADASSMSDNSKVFSQPLTVELLEAHKALSESCK